MTPIDAKPATAALTAPGSSRLEAWRLSFFALALAALAALGCAAAPLSAQDLETFDPDDAFAQAPVEPADTGAIDADLAEPAPAAPRTAPTAPEALPVAEPLPPLAPSNTGQDTLEIYPEPPVESDAVGEEAIASAAPSPDAGATAAEPGASAYEANTYAEDDLIGAAEGVFGKGAKGIAKMIEGLLAKEGRPNGYIVGREAGGAFIVGARYGSGTLHHKVEGDRKVYWTGPSVGFDAGANAANTFVLVYNLWDSEDLFERYPAGEGQAYLVGGLHASYVRRGDVVLIPIRMGAGVRLGVNAGYMKFSKKQRWLPF
ncbi:MAG: DUF1134 domain-containing protein [Erythrobacter sp.]|nr:DUF1134 domain-containing protein [Erythrobacter sp.]